MDNQVLAKLAELKVHVDQRLDEIYSMIQTTGVNKERRSFSPLKPKPQSSIPTPDVESRVTGNAGDLPSASANSNQLPPPAPVSNGAYNGFSPASPVPFGSGDLLNFIHVEYDKILDVALSYVYSTRSFFLHLNYEEVEKFYMQFNEHYNAIVAKNDLLLNPNTISAKQICCVYDQQEESYYRAKVITEAGGKYLIRLIDFGDMKVVDPQFMYQLYPEYAKVPIFALHCYLKDDWTTDFSKLDSVLPEFLNVPNIHGTEVKAKFLRDNQTPGRIAVNLFIKPLDDTLKEIRNCNFDRVPISETTKLHTYNYREFAKDTLSPANFAASTEAYRKFSSIFGNQLSVSQKFTGFCPHVSDISNFIFVQSPAIEFTTNFSNHYRGLIDTVLDSVKVNSLVVFGLKNTFFFRALVLSTSASNSELFAFDFGFTMSVNNQFIHPLLGLFSLEKFPGFSGLCALDNIVPMLDTWSPVAIKTFQTFVQGTFVLLPKSFSNGNTNAEVEMSNKNRASEMLKKFKLGKDDLI